MHAATTKSSRILSLFLLCTAMLITIGLIFIYSASSVYALERCGSASYYVKKQLGGLLLGLIGLVVIRSIPLSFIKKITPLAFWTTFLLTLCTLMPPFALRIHGSSRWFRLAGFSFQPSELLKLAYIVYIAFMLDKKGKRFYTSFSTSFLPFLCILGATSLVLLKQPDFGLTVTLALTTFTMLYIAQTPTRYLVATFASLIPVAIALVVYKPYRMHRIMTFLNPWADPQGSGFQIIQSLIAIGSGSFWGLGITHSRQKFFYLPMQHTDFIFSIIAEETGFIGATILVSLYMLFLYFGIRLAWQLKEAFSRFIVIGFVLLINLQALINLAVATGIAPTKGIGLPFVSYGNTALVCNLCMIGLIINCIASEK